MNDNFVNDISNNIVFKSIEEEANLEFKKVYNRTPLDLMIFNKNKKNEINYLFSLSLNSLTESITIYHCFKKISMFINLLKYSNRVIIPPRSGSVAVLQQNNENSSLISDDNIEMIHKVLNEYSKYVTYLFYHKDSIDILNVHKLFTVCYSSFNISYKNLFNYVIFSKVFKKDVNNQCSEFILFLLSKIDDLKLTFDKKWEKILESLFDLFKIYNSNVEDSNLEYVTFLETTLFNFCYNLICLSNDKYKFYKFLFSSDIIINYFYNDLKGSNYLKFLTLLHITSDDLIKQSNLNISKSAFNIHKKNIKELKKYIDNFSEKDLKLMKTNNNIFPSILFKEYYDDLKNSIDKYSKELNKTKI